MEEDFRIAMIRDYPKNGNHLMVIFDHFFPFNITKGLDAHSDKDKWFITPLTIRTFTNVQDSYNFFKIPPDGIGYATAKDAVMVAKELYAEWIKRQIKIHNLNVCETK